MEKQGKQFVFSSTHPHPSRLQGALDGTTNALSTFSLEHMVGASLPCRYEPEFIPQFDYNALQEYLATTFTKNTTLFEERAVRITITC